MTRFTKPLLTAFFFTLSVTSSVVTEAGCHGRSGGHSGGGSYGSSYHSGPSSYHSHNYPQPVYQQPVYQQPVYQQPVYQQPVYQQPVYQQPVYQQPVYQQPPQPIVNSQPVISPVPQQQLQQQYVAQSGATPLPVPSVQANGIPAGTAVSAPPQQIIPPQTSAPVQQQTQAPAAVGNSAELSALQALGAFAPPQSEGQPSPQTMTDSIPVSQPFIGNWTARLSNGATVLLNLQADGSFHWAATNVSGNTSTFQGQYVVENGSLVLNRNSDNQRLTGTTTMNGNDTFSFSMSNSNAASLEFRRS